MLTACSHPCCAGAGSLKPLAELAALWRQAGLLRSAEGADASAEVGRLIFYCGSGWRSALAWLIARLMGHPDVASFDGGLFEWCLDARRPVLKGDPQNSMVMMRAPNRPSALQEPSWAFFATADDDSCDEGPAGRDLERRRQRAKLQPSAAPPPSNARQFQYS